MGATPSLPTEVLVERGFSEVTQKRLLNDGSGNYTLSHVGIDKSGQSLAFILKFYDF